MHDMFWDVRSNGNDASASDGMYVAQRAENRTQELENRIDRLSMICCAMWTIIQAHTDVGDKELIRLVQELDLADGHLDGKAQTQQVRECTVCKRPVANRHHRCIYCGAERPRNNPFDDVL